MVPALLYLAFRVNALDRPTTGVDSKVSVNAMVQTWPRVLEVYARHLVWPVHLGPSYDVPIETALWPLLLLIVVIVGLLWLVRKSCANIQFGAAWLAITLIPNLALRYLTFDDYVHDRYLYLPSVGLALIAAVWFSRIRFTLTRSVVACALALVLCWGTRSNLLIWRDELSLFTRAIETAPRNPTVKNDLAGVYLKANRGPEAFALLEQVLKLYPGYADANYNMALYYRQIGNSEAANHYMSIAAQQYGR
jgi:tetratricopeptide (TPR) repeat protein